MAEQEVVNGSAGMADAEVMETSVVAPSTLALLEKASLDVAITTAKAYPRSLTKFLNDAVAMASLNEDIAADCVYALPRGGKSIEGPSARLAEIVASAWGNCKAGARVIEEGEEFVTAQGVFHDLERNVSISYEVRRRITDSRGRRYNADMISVTANAACSIALRNSVFKGVPKAYWATAYRAARQVIAGDAKTLASRRAQAIEFFQKIGVPLPSILAVLDVKGVEDITSEHLVTLSGIKTSIRDGETTLDDAFPDPAKKATEAPAGASSPGMAGLKAAVGAEGPKERGTTSDGSPASPPEASASPPSESTTSTPAPLFDAPSLFGAGPLPVKEDWLSAMKAKESKRIGEKGGTLGDQMKALTERMVELSAEYDREAEHRAQMEVQR